MAKEAGLWFNKKVENFPSSSREEWLQKVCRTAKDFFDTLTDLPIELDSNNRNHQKELEDKVKKEPA